MKKNKSYFIPAPMFPRTANPSDIVKPTMGVLDEEQDEKSTKIYDEHDYEVTRKKLITRIVVISLFSLLVIGSLIAVYVLP